MLPANGADSMKDQYVGDINDYRKYSLIRHLSGDDNIPVGVCWMRTPKDDTTHGNRTDYLEQPKKWRHYDPELFDKLHNIVVVNKNRKVSGIEISDILPNAYFHHDELRQGILEREEYYKKALDKFKDAKLVFFDPDIGMEVQSVKRGTKNSIKYLYWDELKLFKKLESVLIYQHFRRKKGENREQFSKIILNEVKEKLEAYGGYALRTAHVVFLLVFHETLEKHYNACIQKLKEQWRDQFIIYPAG